MSLSDLSSPAAVRAAMKEYDVLGRDKILEVYGFGPATKYMVRFEGKEYDSKAIAGIAHKYQYPALGPLHSEDFSGGISSGAAARKLSSLGFGVVGLDAVTNDWTLSECQQTVTKYFEMLRSQLRREDINKAAAYRELSNNLGRPVKAIEYKFQNIDAILSEEDFPRLGKSVAKNYQRLLRSVVMDYISQHSGIFDTRPEEVKVPKRFDEALVDSPRTGPQQKKKKSPTIRSLGVIRDFEENRKLGRLGEQWVLELEKSRLIDAGRRDLAEKVIWTSDELGDGYGYDISSFTEDGEELLIEVKTTNGGIRSAFYITANELDVARQRGKQFHLYRVFDFSHDPKLYRVVGNSVDSMCLTPIAFRVSIA
jgi:uncharacterized protein DUF3883